jgi:hypothetical protein
MTSLTDACFIVRDANVAVEGRLFTDPWGGGSALALN